MDINHVVFPLYKLRSHLKIETNPLGLVKITTIKGTYILDDTSISGTFEERRMILATQYPPEKLYKLKEKVSYLRQLVKYKTGSKFVDYDGNILKYKKGNRLYEVRSHKIDRKTYYNNWTIIRVIGIEQPYLVAHLVMPTTTHVSIMYTKWGPFLYDLTNKYHEPYKRKI